MDVEMEVKSLRAPPCTLEEGKHLMRLRSPRFHLPRSCSQFKALEELLKPQMLAEDAKLMK
jgi:hypothetical protein